MDRLPRPDEILSVCCYAFGVAPHDVLAMRRHPEVVACRTAIIAMIRHRTCLSFPDIASAIGLGNHSTAVTAYRRHEPRMESDPDYAARYFEADHQLSMWMARERVRHGRETA